MIKSLTLYVFLFTGVAVMAQTNQNKTTDVNKDIDLTEVYKQYVLDGYGSPALYIKLANGYYFKSNYPEAKIWYEKYFATNPKANKTTRYRYKQSLKAIAAREKTTLKLAAGSN